MSSLFLSFRYSAWVVFNADGSLEIYIKKLINKRKSAPICVHNNYFRKEYSFVLVNALARMRACTISWKNQCSRNFGKFIKQSDPIRIGRNDPP